ncbi:MAG: LUD domain-containing protein [Thermoflavifilum aggregans]|nr:LUD domain-containing protein [Thermoflavifilum aggregans]
MKVSPAKENILKRIRNALSQPVPLPFPQSEGNSPVFATPPENLDVHFAETFVKLNGKFIFCEDVQVFGKQFFALCHQQGWKQVLCREKHVREWLAADVHSHAGPAISLLPSVPPEQMDVALTGCECLIARTGSVVLSAGQAAGRMPSVFAPVHVVAAFSDQLVWDIRDALQLIKEKYGDSWPSMCSLHTGPSRTSDIEKTLVMGAHGPKEMYVFLIDQPLSRQ